MGSSGALDRAYLRLVLEQAGDLRLFAAQGALGILGDSDLPEACQPGVVVKKPIGQQATSAQNEFQDFGGLNRPDHSRQRPNDPCLLAAGNQPRRRRLFKYASIARALSRQDGEDTTIES